MSLRLIVIGWMLCHAAGALPAADVRTGVSTRETYVGLPITLHIQINNTVEHDAPVMPDVDGLIIESAGPPSHGSTTTTINGRRTHRTTVTYSYHVTPTREGTFTIPSVKIVADDRSTMTKVVRIVASKSETGDLMFVEIEGTAKEIYVGEAVDLTLKIWIRPYRDKEFQVTLDERDMWSLMAERSSWGAFAKKLESMAKDRERPGGRPVLRKDSEGNEREYLLYEIDATIYPDRPGKIDGDDVRIIVKYPEQLGRSRSPFSILNDDDLFSGSGFFNDSFFRNSGSSLTITKSRPIVAEAKVDPIIVKPIPEEGRPQDYRGAVGQYGILTEATPARVKVGDPITLHMGIDGSGPMDLVRAPPIASQPDLIRDFKVPDEPLAGFVEKSRKVFSTTIRPLREGVNQIPPISFTYFDPKSGQFVTTKSDPISIEVDPADVLSLDAIAAGNRSGIGTREDSRESAPKSAASALTIFSGAETLQHVARPPLVSSRLLTMMVVPPMLAMAVFMFASRHVLSATVSARRQFRRSLRSATTAPEVAEALEAFLARRYRLARGRLARDQTVGQLRATGQHELAIRTERLYAQCDKSTSVPATGTSIESLKDEATVIVHEMTRRSLRARRQQKLARLSTTSTILAVSLLFSAQAAQAEQHASELQLSPEQQHTLLDEATSQLRSAAQKPIDMQDPEAFGEAAKKFQLLVDSGVRNDRLYFDLAAAQFRAGMAGHAIANYRRALRLDPSNQLYRNNLAVATHEVASTTIASSGLLGSVRQANDVVLRYVGPSAMKRVFLGMWIAFWIILSLRAVMLPSYWKSAACFALLSAVFAAGSYYLRVSEFVRDDLAVLVTPNVSIREGDGDEFSEISQLENAEGRVVQVLDRRGVWLRIGLDSGMAGWVHADTSEDI